MMRVLATGLAGLFAIGCGEVVPMATPDAAGCADADDDGVCDSQDKCAGFNDTVDTDADGTADGCDKCAAGDDKVDTDADTTADACDKCADFDDRVDANGNQVPDGCDVQTAMFTVKNVSGNWWRGWHTVQTAHTASNDNTITGAYGGGANSYFVFPLTGLSAYSIVSVTLELQLEYYVADASETLSVWDVSTASATVEADAVANAPVYTDLMTGNTYGNLTFTAAELGTVLKVPLNAQANTDVMAKVGTDFTVGIHLDTGATGTVRFSSSSEVQPNVLVVKYLPL
jgi:hypothetical protein